MNLNINIIGRHISLSSNKLKWPLDTPAPYSWLKERNSALEKESLFLFPCFVRFGNRASSPSRELFDEPRAHSFPPVRFCSNFSNTWLFAEAAPNWEFFLQQREKSIGNGQGLLQDIYSSLLKLQWTSSMLPSQAWLGHLECKSLLIRWLIQRVIWILRWKTGLMNQLFVLSSTRGALGGREVLDNIFDQQHNRRVNESLWNSILSGSQRNCSLYDSSVFCFTRENNFTAF